MQYAAFSSWWSITIERRRHRALVRRAVARISRDAMSSTFFAWQRHISAKAVWEAKVGLSRRFLASISHQALYRAFHRWREAARKLRTLDRKVARCVHRMTRNAVANAFIEWAELVEHVTEKRRRDRLVVGRAVVRLSRRLVTEAFQEWLACVHDAKTWTQKLVVMRRFAAAIHQRLFFKAFHKWREMAAEEKRVKFTLARSLMRLTQRLAFAAFNGWYVSARDARVARARLSRALTRLTQRRLYAAFAGWDDHARDRKRRAVLSRRFVARLSSRLQALAFDAWRDATSTRTRRRRISRQSIVKLSRRRVDHAFRPWAELIRHERAVRRNDMITRKIVAAMVHRVAFSAFARWREFLHQIRELKRERKTWEAKLSRCERFVVAVSRRLLWRAFQRWVEMADERSRLRRNVKNALARFTRSSTARAFDRWAEVTAETRRHRVIVRRVVAKMSRASTSSAFYEWRGAARHERARAAAEKAQWRADVVKTERFVLAWANRRFGSAFRAWRDDARRRVSDRRRALAFVTRASKRTLYRSWSTWRFNARECKAKRARARRALAVATRDALASAFYAWSRRTSDEKFWRLQVVVAERFLLAAANRSVFRAFASWRERTLDVRVKETKVLRAVHRLSRKTLARLFYDWLDATTTAEEARRREAAATRAWEAKMTRCERLVRAALRRTLRAAFSRWMEVREETARLNRKLRVAVAKFTRRDVYNAFAAWCESLRIGTRERQSALRVFSEVRYSLRDRADAFYTWSQSVEGARVQNLNLAKRFTLAWTNRAYSFAFIRWRDVVRGRRRERRILSNWSARVRARAATSAFHAWLERARDASRGRALARRAAHRMRDRHLASAFHAWRGAVAETREWSMRVRVSEKFLAAIQHATTYRAFGVWRETTTANKTNEREVLLARHRARRVTRARAFDAWIEATEASRRRRVAVARSERFLRAATRRVQNAAFHRWDEYAAERAAARRRLSVALSRFSTARRAARSTDGRIASRRRTMARVAREGFGSMERRGDAIGVVVVEERDPRRPSSARRRASFRGGRDEPSRRGGGGSFPRRRRSAIPRNVPSVDSFRRRASRASRRRVERFARLRQGGHILGVPPLARTRGEAPPREGGARANPRAMGTARIARRVFPVDVVRVDFADVSDAFDVWFASAFDASRRRHLTRRVVARRVDSTPRGRRFARRCSGRGETRARIVRRAWLESSTRRRARRRLEARDFSPRFNGGASRSSSSSATPRERRNARDSPSRNTRRSIARRDSRDARTFDSRARRSRRGRTSASDATPRASPRRDASRARFGVDSRARWTRGRLSRRRTLGDEIFARAPSLGFRIDDWWPRSRLGFLSFATLARSTLLDVATLGSSTRCFTAEFARRFAGGRSASAGVGGYAPSRLARRRASRVVASPKDSTRGTRTRANAARGAPRFDDATSPSSARFDGSRARRSRARGPRGATPSSRARVSRRDSSRGKSRARGDHAHVGRGDARVAPRRVRVATYDVPRATRVRRASRGGAPSRGVFQVASRDEDDERFAGARRAPRVARPTHVASRSESRVPPRVPRVDASRRGASTTSRRGEARRVARARGRGGAGDGWMGRRRSRP